MNGSENKFKFIFSFTLGPSYYLVDFLIIFVFVLSSMVNKQYNAMKYNKQTYNKQICIFITSRYCFSVKGQQRRVKEGKL